MGSSRPKEASSMYHRALQCTPVHAMAYNNRANILKALAEDQDDHSQRQRTAKQATRGYKRGTPPHHPHTHPPPKINHSINQTPLQPFP